MSTGSARWASERQAQGLHVVARSEPVSHVDAVMVLAFLTMVFAVMVLRFG
ncbi:MAG: hypothetical protein JWP02_3906 [Acidimicrobiales bacterium]|nr:hypothetical protein [Acidimicrobiales bacterium]